MSYQTVENYMIVFFRRVPQVSCSKNTCKLVPISVSEPLTVSDWLIFNELWPPGKVGWAIARLFKPSHLLIRIRSEEVPRASTGLFTRKNNFQISLDRGSSRKASRTNSRKLPQVKWNLIYYYNFSHIIGTRQVVIMCVCGSLDLFICVYAGHGPVDCLVFCQWCGLGKPLCFVFSISLN